MKKKLNTTIHVPSAHLTLSPRATRLSRDKVAIVELDRQRTRLTKVDASLNSQGSASWFLNISILLSNSLVVVDPHGPRDKTICVFSSLIPFFVEL